jgi:hypothetical protein
MTTSVRSFEQRNLRWTDSNSLLRMYDLANEVLKNSRSQLEQTRTNKAIQRLAKELHRRKVRF